MRFVEVMVTMEKDGVIRIPGVERERMGLQEGDQICLLYLAKERGSMKNEAKEFLVERI